MGRLIQNCLNRLPPGSIWSAARDVDEKLTGSLSSLEHEEPTIGAIAAQQSFKSHRIQERHFWRLIFSVAVDLLIVP